ncbi:MAG: hypothetical protein V1777_00105 [Candidatus Micrarchaeota archaeon]
MDIDSVGWGGSLKDELLDDTPKAKKLKSLYQREEEYADVLGPIEGCIATFYLDNPNLTDKNVENAIKNIRTNYKKGILFFKEPIEEAIFKASKVAIRKRPLSHHEYFLVLGYILWSIDNRRWIGTPRAYLDWLIEFFGLTNEKKFPDYTGFNPTQVEEALTKMESEYYALTGEEQKKLGSDDSQPNLELKKILLDVVSNQLRLKKPKATKEGFDRLVANGDDRKTAKEKIAAVLMEEIFLTIKNKDEFNEKRYAEKLSKLNYGL